MESADGGTPRTFKEANPTIAFDRKGIYVATLTVTDPSGAKNTASLDVIAGNAPPAVSIDVKGANKTFFVPDSPLTYTVQVSDREDGTLASGKVPSEQVAFSIDYVPEGFDVASIRNGQAKVDPSTRFAVAKALIAKSDCATCHNRDTKSRGPSFAQLAEKYQPEPGTLAALANKIRNGGTGVWGQEVMPAHPLMTMHEASTLAAYMLSVKESRSVDAASFGHLYAGDSARRQRPRFTRHPRRLLGQGRRRAADADRGGLHRLACAQARSDASRDSAGDPRCAGSRDVWRHHPEGGLAHRLPPPRSHRHHARRSARAGLGPQRQHRRDDRGAHRVADGTR